PVGDVVEMMDAAISAGLVREEGAGRYAFVHALVRETVLVALSTTQRARLHWLIGQELDARADRVNRLDEIANHHAAAADLGEAVAMARRTGDAAALVSTLQARLFVAGQGPDARAMLRDADELATLNIHTGAHGILASVARARALLRLGRRGEAEELIARN